MKNRRVILLLAGGVVLVGVLAAVLIARRQQPSDALIPSGPSYGGKRLSEWVAGYSPTPMGDSPRGPTAEATNAIRAIGSNAIPYLLEWISNEGPYDPSISEVHNDPMMERDSGAADAFAVLGPVAKGAIPELVRISNEPKSHYSAPRALVALGHLGADGLWPLMAVLTNHHQGGFLRGFATQCIRGMGTNASPAVPVLVTYLEDTNHDVAGNIVATLYNMKPVPVEIIPALVECLETGRTEVKRNAMRILGRYGLQARSAVPALLKIIGEGDFETRKDATNALRGIDPQALEKSTAQ